MNSTIRIGRIAGIPIGLNWTWVVVFGLFVWSLADFVFPSTNPGLATATYVSMAVVAATLFFASLLLHELGHALQARRDGVEIDGITLWLFGGVARFRGMFPSAGAEFRIAVAGPLVTAALAALFVGTAVAVHLPVPVDGVVAWLGYINLVLLGFNLLPALPLDGGRLLRAALWGTWHDLARATRAAATTGVVIAYAMIAGGVLSIFTVGASYGGIWLALIGWFVLAGARSEARFVALGAALEGLVVTDLIVHPEAAQVDRPVREFLEGVGDRMAFAAYPVLDGDDPVGILPVPHRSHPSPGWAESRVRERMIPIDRVPVLTLDEPASQAAFDVAGAGADAALVLDDHHRLAGVVFASDLVLLAAGPSRTRRRPPGGSRSDRLDRGTSRRLSTRRRAPARGAEAPGPDDAAAA